MYKLLIAMAIVVIAATVTTAVGRMKDEPQDAPTMDPTIQIDDVPRADVADSPSMQSLLEFVIDSPETPASREVVASDNVVESAIIHLADTHPIEDLSVRERVVKATTSWVTGYRTMLSLGPERAESLAGLVFLNSKSNHEGRIEIRNATAEARRLYGDRLETERNGRWGNELDVLRRYDPHLDRLLREKRERYLQFASDVRNLLTVEQRGILEAHDKLPMD